MNIAKSSVVALAVLLGGQLAIYGDDAHEQLSATSLEFQLTSADGQMVELSRRNATRVVA